MECPLCSSSRSRTLYEGLSRTGDCHVAYDGCLDCTHIYQQYCIGEPGSLGQSVHASLSNDYLAERTENGRMFFRIYGKNILKQPDSDMMFDFGAGCGGWMRAAEELGFRAYGNEPAEDMVRLAEGNAYLLPCATEDIDPGWIADHEERFRLCVVCGALQYMPDPLGCLRLAYRLLRPGGYLYIWNRDWIESMERKGQRIAERASYEAKHGFHRSSYLRLVRSAGFGVLLFNQDSPVSPKHMELMAYKGEEPTYAWSLVSEDTQLFWSRYDCLDRTVESVHCRRVLREAIGWSVPGVRAVAGWFRACRNRLTDTFGCLR